MLALYQGFGGKSGSSPGEGYTCSTFSGQYPSPILGQESPEQPSKGSHEQVEKIRIVNKPCEEPAHSNTKDDIVRGTIQHPEEGSDTPTGKNPYNHKEGREGTVEQVHVSIRMPESPGIFFLLHPNRKVGQVASLLFSTGVSIPAKEEMLVSENSDHNVNEVSPVVVDEVIPKLQNHCHLGHILWITLTSDASLLGWGAYYKDQLIHVRWQFNSEGIVSNILELRTAWKAISHLAHLLKGNPLLLQMENRAAVVYVQNQRKLMADGYPSR